MNVTSTDQTDTRFWPSILQQTKWRCEFFDFRKAQAPGVNFFNCGLVRRPDGLWLVVRRSRNEKNIRIGFNDVVAFLLDEKTHLPEFGRKINIPARFDKEHFEDPRAIFHNGKTYVSTCNFVVLNNGRGWTGAHQVLMVLNSVNKDEWAVSNRFDPVFGNNGERIGKDTGAEKNWLWFFHENKPHMIYQADPHRVVRFTDDLKEEFVYETGDRPMPWNYGIIRGGTPPVLSPDGSEYWTFFHSSLKTGDKYTRRYYMGAYAFESNPPFRVTRMTPEPLLVGSSQDPWTERKPLVVFPCGSELQPNGKWFVTMGVNDLRCAWIEIPQSEIEERSLCLLPVAQKRAPGSLLSCIIHSKKTLKDVTLVCIDDGCAKPELYYRAVKECTNRLSFGDVKLFTSQAGLKNSVKIPPLQSALDCHKFIKKELASHISTSHALVVQWDGYILNETAWRDEWLKYDHISAPQKQGQDVLNGGFSLYSKKLLESMSSDFKEPHQLAFAPEFVSRTFSAESSPYTNQFGFHSYLTQLPVIAARPKIFHHTGDQGDIIYGLAAVKKLGGGVVYISPNSKFGVRQPPTEENCKNLLPLLNVQDYVWKAEYTNKVVPFDHDFNKFRETHVRGNQLLDVHFKCLGLEPDYEPWLTVDYPSVIPGKPIVINRSSRYRNLSFDWKGLVKKHDDNMIFIGTEKEHSDFVRLFGHVPMATTPTLLDAARLIAGAKVFIGNQSCPMAIALGLGKNVIQEVWSGDHIELGDLVAEWNGEGDANCILKRENALYVDDGHRIDIPKKWFA